MKMLPWRKLLRIRVNVALRISAGYGILLMVMLLFAGATFVLLEPVRDAANRVGSESDFANVAAQISTQVGEARGRVFQYVLTANEGDQKRAQTALDQLGQMIAPDRHQERHQDQMGAIASGGDANMAALAAAYKATVDSSVRAVVQRRAATEALLAAATDMRTIVLAIQSAIDQETDLDLVRSGSHMVFMAVQADEAASRYSASRSPADSNIALAALADAQAAAADLGHHAEGHRRLTRFLSALADPRAAFADALHQLVTADAALLRATIARAPAGEAVLRAAAAAREQAATSQRQAVTQMLKSVFTLRRLLLATTVAAVLLGAALATLIGRSISVPLTRLAKAILLLADGDLTVEIPDGKRRDEMGEMANALLVFRANAETTDLLRGEAERVRQAKDKRQQAMDQHTQDFGASTTGVMESLEQSATLVHTTANELLDATGRARARCDETASQAAVSAERLAAMEQATAQMSAGNRQISEQVVRATEAAHDAVERARMTDAKVAAMAAAAERVGTVVRMIRAIAGQTNLLALNATIEAARAGEAGQGFAVVASEVKALAAQTARATQDIEGQIAAIRGVTGEAVQAVAEVCEVIARIEEVATVIAASVEQQSGATRQIETSVQAVLGATQQANESMMDVSSVSQAAGERSRLVVNVADDLREKAGALVGELRQFLAAMAHSEEVSRRRYERVLGGGSVATLNIPGKAAMQVPMINVSRGGVSLRCDVPALSGAAVTITLPGATQPVNARMIRSGNGVLALTFAQTGEAFNIVDAVMDRLHPQAA